MPAKPQEVIKKRFGLDATRKRQTLQQIGDALGVTRERVRQIESEAVYKLRANRSVSPDMKGAFVYFEDYLKKYGGLKREDLLLNDLGDAKEQNLIFFLLCLAPNLRRFEKSADFYSFWATGDTCKQAPAFLNGLVTKLKENKAPLSREAVYAWFAGSPKIFIDGLIETSRTVEVGPLGEIGLTAWPEIKPRGARDAAYLILRKLGRPLHFRDIAGNANDLDGRFFQRKKILPQTVHNELIRDPQFILVGRGIYGLKEWGYSEGTVKDVICGILKENGVSLTRQEILERVLRQRIVQPNTIFLNLNNKACFRKDEEGKYTLKDI